MPDTIENSPWPTAEDGGGRGCHRRIYWLKTSDPQVSVPNRFPDGTDVRVLLPDDALFEPLTAELTERGAEVRAVPYWLEQELVSDLPSAERDEGLRVQAQPTWQVAGAGGSPGRAEDVQAAEVARDAFDALWQAQSLQHKSNASGAPADQVVPDTWLPFLPHASLNPAQAEAAPEVLKGDRHLLVVAPTGAGKTTIGMLAALRAVLGDGRKAAWLVPQRSLTDELDRELAGWRRHGLRVERLSGEYSVDVQRVREADLWVTTTEKFEVLCRTSSMREALNEVGCLIVDEIHLLGDTERGPVLEGVLARIRRDDSRVRVVGLSATVANAEQMADWLDATLLRVAWRPSRLIWQLPVVPFFADRNLTQAARTRLTNLIVDRVTADSGSVLVFCGSKYSVRSTALAIAASRGARTTGISSDDAESLRSICDAAGVSLHYKDWEYKHEAERSFRERRTNVLVATSTVAAGVNLPARAVVVRDTQIGMRDIDVATVQQMFGRAGRLGAGETTGWAFMIVDASERAHWQQRLIGGYTVDSQITSTLPDHVLAEIVQGGVRTSTDAEHWWLHTFAHHQGSPGADPLHRALGFLAGAGYCRLENGEDAQRITATELGTVTSRVMVPSVTGFQLRTALSLMDLPKDAEEAEEMLIGELCEAVPKLSSAVLNDQLKPAVSALLHAGGRVSEVEGFFSAASDAHLLPGDLARAALLAVARSPQAFVRVGQRVAGIPYSSLRPLLDDAPRYLHWLGSQGFLGMVHPWVAIVAADLNRRVRWRRLGPPRGSGRLLWMCEQMATSVEAERQVPLMWAAARHRGLHSPDWSTRTPPSGNRLDRAPYAHLLRERVGEQELSAAEGVLRVQPSHPRKLVVWTGRTFHVRHVRSGEADPVAGDAHAEARNDRCPTAGGTALFSWRGDYRATGWLAAYSAAEAADGP
ncbi:DEAD/DEAH box helicase [Streptomyces fuscichromogenes]|uniref:DEAD/DEAH box helicase n=1 Tax=Streptomyces fuscichromogenes TaxID=1324013 RepID=A0A918CXQ0_9ACTN|nr:DEAD/DEAH box helicase [Streptomyces fuscichromogenes]GGN45490.1 hypothetical protein GCM10011578_097500 [Streptomyces fuscichromogenes]